MSLDVSANTATAFYSPVPIIQAPTLPPAYQRLPDLPELVPTNKALQARGATLTPPSLPERLVNSAYRETFDFRPGYRGDVTLRDNRPNATTSDNNCALWLTGLPAGTTESDLEAALLALPGPPVGGIWTMSVVPPDPKSGHQDAAANISFTRVVAATRLLEHIQDPWHRGFFVGGQRVKGKWNRNRVAPQPPWHRPRRSRVLVITGPRDFVNVASLHDWLSRYVAFVTTGIDVRYDAAAAALAAIGRRYDGHLDRPDQEEWVRRANVGEYVTLVWRFACARGQACIAMSCLHRLREDLALNVRCSYGDDPCEGASWR